MRLACIGRGGVVVRARLHDMEHEHESISPGDKARNLSALRCVVLGVCLVQSGCVPDG